MIITYEFMAKLAKKNRNAAAPGIENLTLKIDEIPNDTSAARINLAIIFAIINVGDGRKNILASQKKAPIAA